MSASPSSSRVSMSSLAPSASTGAKPPVARAIPLQVFRDDTRGKKFLNELRSPADPTNYTVPLEHRNITTTTVREYLRHRQRRRIFISTFSYYIVTAVLCAACAGVLLFYVEKGDLTTTDVSSLSVLMTVLPLAIAFMFNVSIQGYMRILRWWVLARWYWPLQQFDCIMDATSLRGISKLLVYSRRRRWWIIPTAVQSTCIFWLSIHVLGAVSVTLLSLAYDTNGSTGIVTRPGNISVLNLTSNPTFDYAGRSNNSIFDNAWYYATYSSPTVSQGFNTTIKRRDFEWLEGDSCSKPRTCNGGLCSPYDVACSKWSYTFQEKQPFTDIARPSKRSVSANASCELYDIVDSKLGYEAYMDSNITYIDNRQGQNTTRTLDLPYVNHDHFWTLGTTTAYFPVCNDTVPLDRCGEDQRCSHMWVVTGAPDESEYPGTAPNRLFHCKNSISTLLPENGSPHVQLSDSSASILAGAVTHHPNMAGTHYDSKDAWNLRFYGPSLAEDIKLAVESTIAQYTMTVLAAADQGLDWIPDAVPRGEDLRYQVRGQQPYRAQELKVNWWYAISILTVPPLLQLIVMLVIILLANNVVVLDDSPLLKARLLAPIAEKMREGGCLLQLEEVVTLLAKDVGEIRYGWELRENVMHIGVFENETGQPLQSRDSSFPEGWYD